MSKHGRFPRRCGGNPPAIGWVGQRVYIWNRKKKHMVNGVIVLDPPGGTTVIRFGDGRLQHGGTFVAASGQTSGMRAMQKLMLTPRFGPSPFAKALRGHQIIELGRKMGWE